MRVNWNIIKTLLLVVLITCLYAFSSVRSGKRNISHVSVNFLGEENLYITNDAVNKLLIQNDGDVMSVPKEILDLNDLETALKSSPMIKTAEVYLTVNGEVRADIVQKKPIARVNTNASYYIDDEGLFMPLSFNYSARVPLVTGHVYKNKLEAVYQIAQMVNEDEFLKTHIVEIHQHENSTISLKMRVLDFEIFLGDLDHLDKKINNLKAFYQQARKDETLTKYSKVNLQFEDQVVCTKK